ncbi:hypothetical protein GCM10007876_27890 [Litoribrevibacter albus]|uniref:Uncharacterized protein n=1 Tax=Litoribrevibacter albus TaxID=1473156 RepID=A0AA37SAQ9_9GAMM|nr:hypothetical protein GCM10007876_27890 [Litoribrevibacter albus]
MSCPKPLCKENKMEMNDDLLDIYFDEYDDDYLDDDGVEM